MNTIISIVSSLLCLIGTFLSYIKLLNKYENGLLCLIIILYLIYAFQVMKTNIIKKFPAHCTTMYYGKYVVDFGCIFARDPEVDFE